MNAAITLIIIGILVGFVLPNFYAGGKKNKARRQKTLTSRVIGWLLIFLGTYNAIITLLGN